MINNNGQGTLFWQDTWLYDKCISLLFPDLFKMSQQKEISVHDMLTNPQRMSFSRHLVDRWRLDWGKITEDASNLTVKPGENMVCWKFGCNGRFTIKSVYNALTVNDSGPYHKKIWKSKVPAKIKNFLWMISNNATLTKGNMIKRKWAGDPSCFFCTKDESANHLFFQCSSAKAVWAITAKCIGASNIPKSFEQCWVWCEQ